MKSLSNFIQGGIFLVLLTLTFQTFAQTEMSNWRPYDQEGVNIFEPPKEVNTQFDGLKVRIGGSFAQQFQDLTNENEADPNIIMQDGDEINLNEPYALGPGFNLATANLFVDAQLDDGIRVAVESYMSSRHHEEFWVKGGYIQVDKLPMFNNTAWFDENLRVRIGHFQVNYGDQQFRRTDNGNAIYNSFVGNTILDAFATEIGGEVYFFLPNSDLVLMGGMTSGLINGNISEVESVKRSPSIYGKAAFDKQFTDDIRFRLSGSVYYNAESQRNTLYSGDRAGSRFYLAMEPSFYRPRGSTSYRPADAGGLFTSGRWNPDFSRKVTALMVNAFFKFQGLEVFGTFENSSGLNSRDGDDERSVTHLDAELLYRFLKNEQLYIGARYNTLSGDLSLGLDDPSIDRIEIVAGWYPIKHLLLKAAYVQQQYKDFPSENFYHEGEFSGVVLEAIVGF